MNSEIIKSGINIPTNIAAANTMYLTSEKTIFVVCDILNNIFCHELKNLFQLGSIIIHKQLNFILFSRRTVPNHCLMFPLGTNRRIFEICHILQNEQLLITLKPINQCFQISMYDHHIHPNEAKQSQQ